MNRFVSTAALTLILLADGLTASAQLIIAHRGASYDAPENTLAAFRLAWEQNADGIEGDFYLTQDGQIVCTHDKTTKRVSPGLPELTISQTNLEELRRRDVGSWKNAKYANERMPTLQEVLAVVQPGKIIFVEIKCGPEILPVMKPQLENSGLKAEQIVIICFNQEVVQECRKLMPQYKVNWLTGYKQKGGIGPWSPSPESVVEMLKSTQATGLGTQGKLQVVDSDFVSSVRSSGKEFHVWTVNEPADAKAFQKLGADSITTDRPAFLREVLGL